MESVSTELVSLLQFLLPGFITAWIFYAFTSYKKPEQFERVVQALVFTFIVQSIFEVVKLLSIGIGFYYSLGPWKTELDSTLRASIAIILGLIFCFYANNDKLHSVLRKFSMTKKTSFPSEWHGEFSKRVTYVVLNLKNGRRIYGWPREWPADAMSGHFSIEQPSWLTAEGEIPLTGVASIVLSAGDVEYIEFMENTWE
ncbi:hypothetical protein Rhein_0202 [Rheinheimera sp. A13L]|uniref:DUF6338 family protein n=1 Tax=Rheinheimera sp. A13L TaxID=506534 RepID=UPI0002124CD5|nr:DUF6338 family protein [Rheinheimera sp. A13L]EGM79742.1 hypothetical protein Rhein_0202 [Rheinheimera sp. A13L]